MGQYINKSAVVAEMERRIKEILFNHTENALVSKKVYKEILSFINTLESKEIDLENSIVCEVGWYDGFFLDYTQEQQDALLEKIGANVGDKVRIILIKE